MSQIRLVSRSRALWLMCAALVVSALPAHAQQKEPIGRFVFDVRGIFARHKQEPSVATDLGVTAANLPPRSLGFSGGAQFYPLRAGKITFGFGGHVAFAHGSKTLPEPETTTDETTSLVFGTVERHFRTIDPEVSLNFGHRSGWSYISGGIGRTMLYLDRQDAPASAVPSRQTIHYGAGARWFNTHHLAFSVDFRWYSVAEQAAGAGFVAQPRTTLLVLSGGIAIK